MRSLASTGGTVGIARDTALAYKMHDGINDSEVFTDFILECVVHGFLRNGDVLVLDNAAIHHYQDALELETYLGVFIVYFCIFSLHARQS